MVREMAPRSARSHRVRGVRALGLNVAFGVLGCYLVARSLSTLPASLGFAAAAYRTIGAEGLRNKRLTQVSRHASDGEEPDILVNGEISAIELRVLAEYDPIKRTMRDVNEIMSTEDAQLRAEDLGVDLIQFRDADPPLAKIMSQNRYLTDLDKATKAKKKAGKVPKMKEVKMSYTIGDADLRVHCNRMEDWFRKSNRQQVRVLMMLKGRTRAFEKQARDVLMTVRRETASFCKAGGDDPIMKDGRGDLYMMMTAGPDMAILKEIAEEAAAQAEDSAEDEDDEDDEDEEEKESEEIEAVKREMEDMMEDLLDCGIAKNKVRNEPEMQELAAKLRKLRAKANA